MKLRHLIISTTLFLAVTPLFAEVFSCGEHVRFGIPSESDQKLCRENYAVGYNYSNKTAEWVSYKMTSQSAQGNVDRKDAFSEDQEIPTAYRSTLRDYKGTGYDRGHLAPAEDMATTDVTMKQSFLLTNMTPQLPSLNQKAWRVLEEKARRWAIKRKDVQIITGPIFTGSNSVIGQGIKIPSAYYKIVMDPTKMQAIAFIMPQDDIPSNQIANYRVSVRQVESQTHMNFFSDMSKKQQDVLEIGVSKMWE